MKRKGKGKRKGKERKGKRKECWGSEVSGGSRGVAAAGGCTYTDERTVCKDIYLLYVVVAVMGGWVCILAVTMILIYTYLIYMQASLFVIHFVFFVYSFVLSIIPVQGDMEGSIEPFSKESAILTFRSNSSSSSIVTLTKAVMMTRQHMLFRECLQLRFKALYV